MPYPKSGTVLRASYGRTMETPYNENLLLSGGYGLNGLFGPSDAVPVGTRDEGEVGIQQAIGRWVVADFGYFNKKTTNGYDFGVLFDTPIAFPIAWDHSRINGVAGRVNLVEHKGFSAFVVMAHTNAIFSPPGVGGLLLEQPAGDFRIDHDQKFNATTSLQYTINKTSAAWVGLVWRYDSGLVAGSVGSLEDALALTGDQQATIGFYCGTAVPTRDQALTGEDCTVSNYGATRLRIPAEGTADDVANPPRIAPRHLFDVGVGHGQLAPLEQDEAPPPVQCDQPDEQRGVVQLPVDLQRNALRHPAGLQTGGGLHVLRPVSPPGRLWRGTTNAPTTAPARSRLRRVASRVWPVASQPYSGQPLSRATIPSRHAVHLSEP